MDDTIPQTHLPSPPHYNPVRNEYDAAWEHYGQPSFSSNNALPTQAPPFFQPSAGTFPFDVHHEMIPITQAFSAIPPSNAQYGSMSIPSHPHLNSSELTTRPRGRPPKPKTSRDEPSSKRQKISTAPSTNNRISAVYAGQDECFSASQSSCCSSCSEGEPCAAPGCDGQRIAVVPCTKQGCEQPVCTDPCLVATLPSQQVRLEQGVVPSASRLEIWENTTWSPEISRVATQMNVDSSGSNIDPALMALSGPEYVQTVSPAPTTPPIEENNLPTPYSPINALPTPQSTNYHPQSTHPNESSAIVQGTGTQWQNQYYDAVDTGNEFSMFYCPWEGCHQPFPSQEVWWTSHLHQDHLDPQMTFPCLLQAESCPPTIGSNPLDHLKVDHGYHFDMNSGGLSCPAPACPPGETFCNPAMLHNHFDHAHAMPAQGSLRCQLNTCNTLFEDSQQFFTHISECHSDAVPIPKEDDIDLNSPVEMVKREADISKLELPNEDRPHACRWKNDDGAFCGLACKSEDELQIHVKNEHLAHMGAKSGYICQWEGCKRLEKRGDKLGFSQRGKLERHMSTHTGCEYHYFFLDQKT